MPKNQVGKIIYFLFPYQQTTNFFQTFPGWKTTELFSILFDNPNESCEQMSEENQQEKRSSTKNLYSVFSNIESKK